MWTFAPRWLTNSYAQALSVRDALRSRRLIESSWYQRQWGQVFALADRLLVLGVSLVVAAIASHACGAATAI
jgi:hypothetical protein